MFSEQSGEEAAFGLMRSLSKLVDEAVREQGGVVYSFKLLGGFPPQTRTLTRKNFSACWLPSP